MLSPLASVTRTWGYSGVKWAVGITFLRTMFLAELGGGEDMSEKLLKRKGKIDLPAHTSLLPVKGQ